jgi:hypothetical protein
MKTFPASYDSTTKIMSVVLCVVLVVIAASTRSALAAGVGVILIGLSYGYSPRSYTILERCVMVSRLIGNARIPLVDVREIRAATAEDLRGAIRLWASGGLFGYYGLFRTSKLGKCTWYVTNRSHAVVLITGAKTALFSPDDVDGLLAAVRTAVPVPEQAAGAWDRAMDSGSTRTGTWIGAAVAVVALAVTALAFWYSPGPPRVTLSADALTIHDRFYPVTLKAADVDVAHVRVVDLIADQQWQPTARTNGFANAHYSSGWFRLVNGQKVRLYSAGGKRLVLLPPNGNGAAVLLEVRDPDRFVEEVRRQFTMR